MKKTDETWSKISNLSNIQDTEYPFITMYMNVNSNQFLDQMEKNRIFLKNSIARFLKSIRKEPDRQKLACFIEDVKKIRNFIKEGMETSTHGLAIFACEKLGIFEVFESTVPFENEFVVDTFPHLKQLVYFHDEHEKILTVVLASNYSQVYEVKLGGCVNERTHIHTDVHRFHKKGGWSQFRYQRGIEQEKSWHYKEVAEAATKIFDEEGFENVIIMGSEYEGQNFKAYLPQRVKNSVVSIMPFGPEDTVDSMLDKVFDDMYIEEKVKELKMVRKIIDDACSTTTNGASLGVEDTIELAKEGRVDTLAVIKEDIMPGFRSGECLYTAMGQKKPGCPECNLHSKDTDLIEELIRLTVKNGGKVEMFGRETPAAGELEKHDNVGAILRY